jgi:hypothetical protein
MDGYARFRTLVERASRSRSPAGQAILGGFAPDLVTPIVSRWFSKARLAVLDPGEALASRVVDAPASAEPPPEPFAAPPAVTS